MEGFATLKKTNEELNQMVLGQIKKSELEKAITVVAQQ